MNDRKMARAKEEFVKIGGYSKDDWIEPNQQYHGWVFERNDVPTGVITVDDGFTKREMEYLQDYLKFMHNPKSKKVQRFQEIDPIGCNIEGLRKQDSKYRKKGDPLKKNRIKVETGWKYTYARENTGPHKWHQLNRSKLKMEALKVTKFVSLRFQGLFKDMKIPEMAQVNSYNGAYGILEEMQYIHYVLQGQQIFILVFGQEIKFIIIYNI